VPETDHPTGLVEGPQVDLLVREASAVRQGEPGPHLGDDLLACVLGGVYTDVEKTMIELQRGPIVQETRSAFQTAMQDRFVDTVRRLSGREVVAFISNSHIGPDMEIELFFLGPPGDVGPAAV